MALADAIFVDSAITVTNDPASTTVSGLGHLEGETVAVLGDGVYLDTYTVSGGSITVSTKVSTAQVGLAYTSKLRTMKISEIAGEDVAYGSITRVPEAVFNFLDSLGVQYGADENTLYDFHWDSTTELNSGLFPETIDGGFSLDSSVYIIGSEPLPCTVRAIILRTEKTGR